MNELEYYENIIETLGEFSNDYTVQNIKIEPGKNGVEVSFELVDKESDDNGSDKEVGEEVPIDPSPVKPLPKTEDSSEKPKEDEGEASIEEEINPVIDLGEDPDAESSLTPEPMQPEPLEAKPKKKGFMKKVFKKK